MSGDSRGPGDRVVGEYVDAEAYRSNGKLVQPSGTRADRPAFLRMVADIKAGRAQGIIAWREDRLYRSLRSAAVIDDLIDSAGVQIILCKETFDRNMLGFKAAIGRYEITAIKERMAMGREGRTRRGLPLNKVPHCYLRGLDAQGNTIYQINPEWRGVLDEMARLFLDHVSFSEIATRLRKPNGKLFNPSLIKRFLSHPFLHGEVPYLWRTSNFTKSKVSTPGQHPSAWKPETVKAIKAELARRAALGRSSPRRTDAVFSGVLRCGFCGRAMHSTIQAKGNRRVYGCARNYLIKAKWMEGGSHPPNYIHETKLLRVFRAWLADADLESLLQSIAVSPLDIEHRVWMEHRVAKLDAQLLDLRNDLGHTRSAAGRATLEQEIDRLDTERAGLVTDLAGMSGRIDLEDESEIRAGLEQIKHDDSIWDLPKVELRRVLTNFFPAIYLKRGVIVSGVDR